MEVVEKLWLYDNRMICCLSFDLADPTDQTDQPDSNNQQPITPKTETTPSFRSEPLMFTVPKGACLASKQGENRLGGRVRLS
jgi:hypothetical protein